MASSLKLFCFAIALAVTALIFPAPQAQASDTEMVPVWPPEHVLTAIPGGGAGTLAVTSVCLLCRCCSTSNLTNCQAMNCCSHYNCDPTGNNCKFLQQKCGCSGC